MTLSRALFFSGIAFVLGIAADFFWNIPWPIVWAFLLVSIGLILISMICYYFLRLPILKKSFPFSRLLYIGFWGLSFVLGIARMQMAQFDIANNPLTKLNDSKQKIVLSGYVASPVDVRGGYQFFKFKPNQINGLVLVTDKSYPSYKYLDQIQITGELKTPAQLGDFDYKDYLLKDGVYSVMDFPSIAWLGVPHRYNAWSFVYEKIIFMRDRLTQSLNQSFSARNASLLLGIVFGNDRTIPKDLKEQFQISGLSHITAVSGGNIVVLISIVMPLLLFLGFWRRQAFYGSLVFAWFYIALVGFPASGVRAVIMASLVLAAEALGRQNTSSRTIVLAAAVMILQNPLLLFFDVGFQLSFLAALGIIYCKPIIDGFFFFPKKVAAQALPQKFIAERIQELFDILCITFSAQIFTLPILIYDFGSLSLIAPVANVLILPIISPLMILGFMASVFGTASGFLGWVFSIPSNALMAYVVFVLRVLSQPWAVVKTPSISMWWVGVYFLVSSFIVWRMRSMIHKTPR